MLQAKGLGIGLSDEGGFAPDLDSNRQALEVIVEAIQKAGYSVGDEIALGLDVASSEFYNDGTYTFEGQQRDAAAMIEYYAELVNDFPIISIEDPLDEQDWQGWTDLTDKLGETVQLVGDDLYVTNVER